MCLNSTLLHTSKHILGSDVFSLHTSVPKTERFISITSTGWKKYWFWQNSKYPWAWLTVDCSDLGFFLFFSKSKAAQLQIILQDFSKLCISQQDLLQRSIHTNTTHATGVGFFGCPLVVKHTHFDWQIAPLLSPLCLLSKVFLLTHPSVRLYQSYAPSRLH